MTVSTWSLPHSIAEPPSGSQRTRPSEVGAQKSPPVLPVVSQNVVSPLCEQPCGPWQSLKMTHLPLMHWSNRPLPVSQVSPSELAHVPSANGAIAGAHATSSRMGSQRFKVREKVARLR